MGVILTGGLLIIVGAVCLFFGYSSSNWLIASIGWACLLIGAFAAMFGLGKRSKKTVEIPNQKRADSGHTEIRALIQAMGVVAVADEKIREQELRTIATIHEQMLGLTITHEEIHEILAEFDDDFDITKRLTQSRSDISPAMKRTIVKCCHLVMVSDLEIVAQEESKISEIGLALGFEQSEVDDMVASAGI